MRVFGLLLCLLSLPLLANTSLTTQIHDVDYGFNSHDEILVLLTSGHVAKVKQENRSFLERFVSMKSAKKSWYKVTMNQDRYITNLELSKAPTEEVEKNKLFSSMAIDDEGYVPTTIADVATAKKYFREARYNPKDSQCFNRAMIWTYEWWKNHSLRSGKILIFFTRTYIRRYNFEWWFHIAPYVHVKDGDKVVERVMDRKYSSGPLEFGKWTNIFMRNDAPCPVITRYSEYADYPYSGECFIIRTHMYTYQPADLQMYEAWGYKKDAFRMDEVNAAYLEAFDEVH